jgi:hypothetical protein
MRKIMLALGAAIAVFAAGTLTTGSASAMTVSSPAGIAAAIDDASLAENVAYVCRRVRVCGPYGCGWRRQCYNTRPYYRPYYRPYHRPYRHYRYRHYRY